MEKSPSVYNWMVKKYKCDILPCKIANLINELCDGRVWYVKRSLSEVSIYYLFSLKIDLPRSSAWCNVNEMLAKQQHVNNQQWRVWMSVLLMAAPFGGKRLLWLVPRQWYKIVDSSSGCWPPQMLTKILPHNPRYKACQGILREGWASLDHNEFSSHSSCWGTSADDS